MPAPNWLSGMVLPEPERGPRGERVVPYEAVAQAVAMADAALKEKTRTAQRSALAAASLGFQKGVAATQAAMAQQVRVLMRLMRLRGRIASGGAEGATGGMLFGRCTGNGALRCSGGISAAHSARL